ncbi:MAG: type II secretion system major pseudopilin GspG [Deltaproteobacteria bacterium]|nr:type II secretion system major pseudopilin GspG [Deltaproteobacteria bacterium]MBW2359897.1 type II secretion system major pseudopilin GspG [Deltaproteobacteria bacterium]
MHNRHTRHGFTLIEIMAVVLIIGLLTGVVGFQIFAQVDKGRVVAARTQMNMLEGGLESYRMDNARFPTTEQGLASLFNAPTSEPTPRNYQPGGYLKGGREPVDPWGNPYLYESPGQHNEHSVDIWSYGADGQAGGEGIDEDIGNWFEAEES